MTGKPKFPGRFSSQAVLIERPEEGVFPDELLVMPVIDKPTAVNCRRITVTLRNRSNHEVTIKRGTPIAHVFPVDVVKEVLVKGKPKPFPSELSSFSFNFGNSPVPPEWKERLCQEMMKRKEVFSCSEFDVGCAKSTEHTIRVTDDKPFRERSRRLAPHDVDDVRKHINELKEAGIISSLGVPMRHRLLLCARKMEPYECVWITEH